MQPISSSRSDLGSSAVNTLNKFGEAGMAAACPFSSSCCFFDSSLLCLGGTPTTTGLFSNLHSHNSHTPAIHTTVMKQQQPALQKTSAKNTHKIKHQSCEFELGARPFF
jgi:hypothetical protein